jgi:hypothetical protein
MPAHECSFHAHKTADCRVLGPGVNRWYGMAGRQRDDLSGMGKKKTVMIVAR